MKGQLPNQVGCSPSYVHFFMLQVCQEEKGGINCGKQSTGAFDVVSVSNPVTLTLTYTGGDPATADG